jgi:hypothetical protein
MFRTANGGTRLDHINRHKIKYIKAGTMWKAIWIEWLMKKQGDRARAWERRTYRLKSKQVSLPSACSENWLFFNFVGRVRLSPLGTECLAGETEIFEENLPQCCFAHQIPMTWPGTRTRAATVRSRQLKAWATARPCSDNEDEYCTSQNSQLIDMGCCRLTVCD